MRDLPCSGSAVIMTSWHIYLNGGCAITRLCDNSSRFLTSAQSDRGMIHRHLYCKFDAADKSIRNVYLRFKGLICSFRDIHFRFEGLMAE